MQTKALHTGKHFKQYLKDNNLHIEDLRIYSKIELIDGNRAPTWHNIWLTLVSTKQARFIKIRLFDCYICFDQEYRCLISTFITTML